MVCQLVIKCNSKPGARLPEYKTSGAAGADVCAFVDEPVVIAPSARALIPTGLFFEIPDSYEIQVRARSGLAIKNGIAVLNAPGTVDSDYRGELCVILYNSSDTPFTVNNGDRIAQIVVAPVTRANFVEAGSLSETDRGSGGFGSTGVGTSA